MKSPIYVEVPTELKKRIRGHAYAASKTQAEVVTAALVEYLARHGEQPRGPGVRKGKAGES